MTITTYTDREIALTKQLSAMTSTATEYQKASDKMAWNHIERDALSVRVAELEKENEAFEKCLETENSARQNVVEMRSILAIENDTLRQQLAAATQLAQLNGEIAAELKADKLALEAAIEDSRKQEPVAVVGSHWNRGGGFDLHSFTSQPQAGTKLYATPVVAPDVLKDAVKQIPAAAFRHGLSLVKTADGFTLLRLGTVTAAMGGTND